MLLKIGMKISGRDVHGKKCCGTILFFLERTVIIEEKTKYGNERYLLTKKELERQGYEFSNDCK